MTDTPASLQTKIKQQGAVPRHLGVVMDGNRRWAKANKLKVMQGHDYGAEQGDALCRWAMGLDIPEISLWALSTENLKRSKIQLAYLMNILRAYLKRYLRDDFLYEHQIQVKFMGRLDWLPADVRELALLVEKKTAKHSAMRLNACIAYGGKQEIADATQAIARLAVAGELDPERITPDTLGQHMYPFIHPPDLIVRTGGEQRTSGYFMWHADYTEWVFSDKLFPDFSEEDFYRSILEYQTRERRFGQ